MLQWAHGKIFVKFSKKRQLAGEGHFDKTGMQAKSGERLPIFYEDEEILFPLYRMLPHSLARAQEFTLFKLNRHRIKRPMADFGCGDGSFASVLFEDIEFGIDNDPEALAIARKGNAYKRLILSNSEGIPLADNSVKTVISNSVLEHVDELELFLREINRILNPDGLLIFSVPLIQYREHLAKYFGRKTSERLNKEAYHRNLFSSEEWTDILKLTGFELVSQTRYQPDWFVFWYQILRLTGKTGFGLVIPSLPDMVKKRYKAKMIEAIKKSIKCGDKGGSAFFIAEKIKK